MHDPDVERLREIAVGEFYSLNIPDRETLATAAGHLESLQAERAGLQARIKFTEHFESLKYHNAILRSAVDQLIDAHYIHAGDFVICTACGVRGTGIPDKHDPECRVDNAYRALLLTGVVPVPYLEAPLPIPDGTLPTISPS